MNPSNEVPEKKRVGDVEGEDRWFLKNESMPASQSLVDVIVDLKIHFLW